MEVLRRARRRTRPYWVGLLWLTLVALCVLQPLLHSQDDIVDPPRRLSEEGGSKAGRDLFSLQQRRQGAVLLHCLGLLYTFVAIALVCDECFVPALEVIIEEFGLSPDVAGATFMAAGGSAPEFFTSLIGAFSQSDVGTGTIIGSAVFNVLFVIGACALAAKKPLELTWFPLARDSIFYAVSLIVVTGFFLDGKIMWFESLSLFIIYLAYVTFMRFNPKIEEWATRRVSGTYEDKGGPTEPDPSGMVVEAWAKDRDVDLEVRVTDASAVTGQSLEQTERKISKESSRDNSIHSVTVSNRSIGADGDKRKKFRHRSLSRRESSKEPPKIASAVAQPSGDAFDCKEAADATAENDEEAPESRHPPPVQNAPEGEMPASPGGQPPWHVISMESSLVGIVPTDQPAAMPRISGESSKPDDWGGDDVEKVPSNEQQEEGEEEENSPLSLAPPDDGGALDWILYVLKLPILVCLVFTVPDVRREGNLPLGLTWRKLWPASFGLSILWIAVFVYAMVWLVERVAETAHLADKEHIMGLTILAAGTSVPDFLTSVIVAREGHGDMAISSSIGSNIFDVTVGLPIPWLLYSIAYGGEPVLIKNQGLEVNVLLLLGMLGVTISSIRCHGWVMTKLMGFSMLLLYVLFVIVSVILASLPQGSLKLIDVG